MFKRISVSLFLCVLALVASTAPTDAQTRGIDKINHVVIIFMENWTFDAHYGHVPRRERFECSRRKNYSGGQGRQAVRNAAACHQQLPEHRTPIRAFPPNLPNAPFMIDQYVPADQKIPSPVHRFYEYQLQINGGKMDKYVAWSRYGRVGDGLLRYGKTAAVSVRQRLYARRQLFFERVRRLDAQSFLVGLRVHAGLEGCAREIYCATRNMMRTGS